MPNWGYSLQNYDKDKMAITSGRDMRISPKAAREICAFIRKMNLQDAKHTLERVMDLQVAIPYKRHKKEVPHRRGLVGWYAGRYPTKAAKAILMLLNGVQASAEEKGLDTERLRIIHAAAQRATKILKIIPRAFGRSSAYNRELTHVELAVAEI